MVSSYAKVFRHANQCTDYGRTRCTANRRERILSEGGGTGGFEIEKLCCGFRTNVVVNTVWILIPTYFPTDETNI